ncbi:MAG TPA: transcription antitermination factor NusB [Erythrobacter sp.]|jgi:transcription antitermination protein NusB|nr:transcription antitermination factor NusB [Erythrobacter sp.]
MNHAPKSQARSAARLAAVQALYQLHMEKTALAKLLDEFHQHRLGRAVDDEGEGEPVYAEAEVEFFDDVVRGVAARLDEIDALVASKLAAGWTTARLDKTMLQVLRAGAYELLARRDIPVAVAINEYVEVAKAFFDDTEARFVNGVLDAVAKDARAG